MNKFANIIIFAVPIIFAIVFHEIAHGLVAYRFGDPTAKQMGRLKLNPLVHVDIVGTIIVPAILIITQSPFLFGWAKPVPVNFNNLRKPKKHMVLVSLAGPVSNMIIAIISLIAIKIIYIIQPAVFTSDSLPMTPLIFILKPLALMLPISLLANIALGIFNLTPIPPLDGGRIVTGLLPERYSRKYAKIEPFGFPILILLFMSGAINYLGIVISYIIILMSYFSQVPLFAIINRIIS